MNKDKYVSFQQLRRASVTINSYFRGQMMFAVDD